MHRLKELAVFFVGIYCFWKTFSYIISIDFERKRLERRLWDAEREANAKEAEAEEVIRILRSRRSEKEKESFSF